MNNMSDKTSQPVYEDIEIVVDRKQEPMRIDKFLMNRLEKVSRSKIQSAIKSGEITVDGETVKPNAILKPEQTIQLTIPRSPFNQGLKKEEIPLDIVYEDDHVLVINKQAGLVVHPAHGNWTGTLVNGLAHYLGTDLPVSPGDSQDRIGLVHRLDKDTSGIMVIAKSPEAMVHLSEQFANRTIERRYWAMVWGEPEPESGRIEGNIGRNPNNRLQMTVFTESEDGKYAATNYKVIKPLYYVSLIECKLETGRTHQIRVHMKHIGHPLFNDARYGGDSILKGTVFNKYKQFVQNAFDLLPRQALHAKTLGFIHPITQEYMKFDSELPTDFQECLDKWENYLNSRKKIDG